MWLFTCLPLVGGNITESQSLRIIINLLKIVQTQFIYCISRYSLIRGNIGYVLCFGNFRIIYNSTDAITSGIFIRLALLMKDRLAIRDIYA